MEQMKFPTSLALLNKLSNLSNGRVDFEDSWLTKSRLKTKYEMQACQLIKKGPWKLLTNLS
jgi:hypothetical protein